MQANSRANDIGIVPGHSHAMDRAVNIVSSDPLWVGWVININNHQTATDDVRSGGPWSLRHVGVRARQSYIEGFAAAVVTADAVGIGWIAEIDNVQSSSIGDGLRYDIGVVS